MKLVRLLHRQSNQAFHFAMSSLTSRGLKAQVFRSQFRDGGCIVVRNGSAVRIAEVVKVNTVDGVFCDQFPRKVEYELLNLGG